MDDFFGKKYKRFLIIPLILIVLFSFLIFIFPGVSPGIDLVGGNEITIRSKNQLNEQEIISVLNEEFSLSELSVSTLASPTSFGALIRYGNNPIINEVESLLANAEFNLDDDIISIEYSKKAIFLLNGLEKEYANAKLALLDAQDALLEYKEDFSASLQQALENKLNLGENFEFQKKEISPTIGAAALSSMLQISIWGFVLITIIIFIAFRKFVPTAAIILAMIFDVMAGLVGMALLNIPLTITTIPALLMLIGYSVDTDIMLTSRLLKNHGGTNGERATTSMKTGLTMTGTTLAALIPMIIISYFYQIEVVYNISAILLFGLIGDLISTWLMNAPILLWFIEGKK
ncbi:MAG: hypothetical protein PHP82_02170 [Candidatus ainarchaeum sp.]|nr:hypothetical protein [Candidatus ainarchaeum sp.]